MLTRCKRVPGMTKKRYDENKEMEGKSQGTTEREETEEEKLKREREIT